MPTPKWQSMPDNVPGDAEVVWVRRVYWSTPSLATWDEIDQEFTYGSGLVVPWWGVMQWKATS